MEILIGTYLALLPIIMGAILAWASSCNKRHKGKEAERDIYNQAIGNGVKLILRYMLKRYHAEYMIQGKITYVQYKEWNDIFQAYVALHGNFVAKDWNEDIQKLEKVDSINDQTPFEELLYKCKHGHFTAD